MTEWEIYWLLKLDHIRALFIFISIFLGFGWAFFCVAWGISFGKQEEEQHEIARKYKNILTLPFIVFVLLATLTPTTKQMAAIHICPPVINNEKVRELPSETLWLLDLSIEKAKEKLKVT